MAALIKSHTCIHVNRWVLSFDIYECCHMYTKLKTKKAHLLIWHKIQPKYNKSFKYSQFEVKSKFQKYSSQKNKSRFRVLVWPCPQNFSDLKTPHIEERFLLHVVLHVKYMWLKNPILIAVMPWCGLPSLWFVPHIFAFTLVRHQSQHHKGCCHYESGGG